MKKAIPTAPRRRPVDIAFYLPTCERTRRRGGSRAPRPAPLLRRGHLARREHLLERLLVEHGARPGSRPSQVCCPPPGLPPRSSSSSRRNPSPFAPSALSAAPASSRVRRSSVPVSTNVSPASGCAATRSSATPVSCDARGLAGEVLLEGEPRHAQALEHREVLRDAEELPHALRDLRPHAVDGAMSSSFATMSASSVRGSGARVPRPRSCPHGGCPGRRARRLSGCAFDFTSSSTTFAAMVAPTGMGSPARTPRRLSSLR